MAAQPDAPDLHLQLVRDPGEWFDAANLMLLSELSRRAPDAIDWRPLFASGVVQILDDFEAGRHWLSRN